MHQNYKSYTDAVNKGPSYKVSRIDPSSDGEYCDFGGVL